MPQTPIIWPKFENIYLNRAKFLEKPAFEILQKYTLIQPAALKAMWNGPGRFYHNWNHARFMMGLAAEMKPYIQEDCDFDAVIIAILFHDIIYVPGSKQNELMSAAVFRGCARTDITWGREGEIYDAIRETDYANSEPVYRFMRPVAFWLQQLDLYQLIQCKEHDLRRDALGNFVQVWCEFEDVINPSRDWKNIPQARIAFETAQNAFLTGLAEKFNFLYDPITWSEIEFEDLRKDIIDLTDLS